MISANLKIRCPICADGFEQSQRALFIKHCVTAKHLDNLYNGQEIGEEVKLEEYNTLRSVHDIEKGVNEYLKSDKSGTRHLNYKKLRIQVTRESRSGEDTDKNDSSSQYSQEQLNQVILNDENYGQSELPQSIGIENNLHGVYQHLSPLGNDYSLLEISSNHLDVISTMPITSHIEEEVDAVSISHSDSMFTLLDSDSTDEESTHEWDNYMDSNKGRPGLDIQDDQECLNKSANSSSPWFKFEERHTESDTNFPEADMYDKNEWYPFPSRTFAILYALATSTSLAFSCKQLSAIWNVLQQLLDVAIPSISTLKRFREKIPSPLVIKSYVENGEKNYPFYHISLTDLIRMEMANEQSALCLQESSQIVIKSNSTIPILSAELESGVRIYKEVWTAQKWERSPSLQCPLYVHPNNIKYWFGDVVKFGEPYATNQTSAHQNDECGIFCGQCDIIIGTTTIPHILYHKIQRLQEGVFAIPYNLEEWSHQKPLLKPALNLIHKYEICEEYPPQTGFAVIVSKHHKAGQSESEYIIRSKELLSCHFQKFSVKELWQTLGSKHSVRVVNLTLWQDGLSGNRTKKWNPHEATLLSFPGLTSSVKAGKDYLRFLSIARDSPGISLLKPIVNKITQLQRRIVGYDASRKQLTIITGSLLIMKGDNPAASDLANHSWKSDFPCRICFYNKKSPSNGTEDPDPSTISISRGA
ncbi:hypothetical protein L873DRAFT_1788208 [Choiromyces venosus 120613-1]|uniref:Uncharacterized protein n=1 Tax=Choiromyces venosus 120613-1 TaxID=1336337 RepID=A0A3N4K6I0_9PEZI|nr:hypothetical protein L873DRAFT_1788208 [Choiromyces venosus 120613-1]